MNYSTRGLLVAAWMGAMASPAFSETIDPTLRDAADIDMAAPGDPNAPNFSPVILREEPASVAPKAAAEPAARDIPTIETNNEARSHADVTFVTGGIGEGERQAIEGAKADYNLHVMSASVKGAFVGDAQVTITRKKGAETEEMLSVIAGPLLYVHLPAGSYTLHATLGLQAKKQNFTIAKGKSARVHLSWKVATTLAN